MLELYDIIWRDKEVVGCLEYDTNRKKFHAYLRKGAKGNPRGLFGILKTDTEADDRRVRAYFDDCVVPKTRQNIDDILKHIGLPYYDQWEIYKHNSGKNVSDYASIRFRGTSDREDFFRPESEL